MKSLNEVFADPARPGGDGARADGQPAQMPEPPPKPETGAPEAKPEPQRDERGKFAAKPDSSPPEEADSKPGTEPEPATVPRKALEDERRKRQEAEKRAAEVAEWQAKFEQLQREVQASQRPTPPQAQQPQSQTPPPLAFDWDDPNKPFQTIQQSQAQLAQAIPLIAEEAAWRRTADMSVAIARGQHTDYDAVEAVFVEEAQKNPALIRQMRQHPHPAAFAYETGKKLKALRDVGDPETWMQETERKIRERLEAEYAERAQQTPAVNRPASLPRTLADARAAPGSARSNASTANRPPLSAIFTR